MIHHLHAAICSDFSVNIDDTVQTLSIWCELHDMLMIMLNAHALQVSLAGPAVVCLYQGLQTVVSSLYYHLWPQCCSKEALEALFSSYLSPFIIQYESRLASNLMQPGYLYI